jgi:hypothetical protein
MAKRKGQRTTSADLFSQSPIKVGDTVLLGGTHASYPATWYMGGVLWVGDEEILVQRSTLNGESYSQLYTIYAVRAVGSVADLSKLQRDAVEAVKPLMKAVHEAESALGDARDKLHNHLDDLCTGGLLKHIPWDREASDAFDKAERSVVEKVDEEQLAAEAASA